MRPFRPFAASAVLLALAAPATAQAKSRTAGPTRAPVSSARLASPTPIPALQAVPGRPAFYPRVPSPIELGPGGNYAARAYQAQNGGQTPDPLH